MKAQIGEFVKMRDGRFGTVVDHEWDDDSGDLYYIHVLETNTTIIARPSKIVAAVNPNDVKEGD